MKPKKAIDEWPWVTKARAAEACGYSVRNFSERIQPRLDKSATRGAGAALRFNVVMTISVLVSYVGEQNRPKPEDADPLLNGDGLEGDALEEYRREATIEKRLKNDVTRRDLVDRQKLLNALGAAFSAGAGRGNKLVKKFGNDAGRMWNESMKAMQSAAEANLISDEQARN